MKVSLKQGSSGDLQKEAMKVESLLVYCLPLNNSRGRIVTFVSLLSDLLYSLSNLDTILYDYLCLPLENSPDDRGYYSREDGSLEQFIIESSHSSFLLLEAQFGNTKQQQHF
jgi:hypothetical protein